MDNKKLGDKGEDIAAHLLASKGYRILHRNWVYDHKELDIVAENDEYLVVTEVKSRTEDYYEEPYEAITNRKIRMLADATEAYVNKFNISKEVRFDVVSIVFEGRGHKAEHIEGAFRPWMK